MANAKYYCAQVSYDYRVHVHIAGVDSFGDGSRRGWRLELWPLFIVMGLFHEIKFMLLEKKERKKDKRKKQKQIYMGLFLYCFGFVLCVCPHPSPPLIFEG